MASSISGPNAQKNTMLPMMCIQPPCMNMEVRMVIQSRPATMSAGITDHCWTKASPPANSSRNTSALAAMIKHGDHGTMRGLPGDVA